MQVISVILTLLAVFCVNYYLCKAIKVAFQFSRSTRHPILFGLIWPYMALVPHLYKFFFGDDGGRDEAD